MKKRLNLKKRISKFMAAALVVNSLAVFNLGVLNANAQTSAGVVNLAATQVGYHEKASYSQLDDFTANIGSANYNKYARDIGIANGQPWCATFVWWCMAVNGMPQDAYPQSAYVPTIKNWFAQRGQFMYRGTYTPKAGDYIIFGDSDHVGLVEHVSGNYVNTIEGNTSNAVKRHSYRMDSSYILGYGVVNYGGDFTAPTISNVAISEVSEGGYTVTCTIADDSGISYVAFPTWTHANGQDDLDLNWYLPSGRSYGTIEGNVAKFRVDTAQHNNELGYYATHIYAQDVNGNKMGPIELNVDLSNIPVLEEPSVPEAKPEDILDSTIDAGYDAAENLTPVVTEQTTTETPDESEDVLDTTINTAIDSAENTESEGADESLESTGSEVTDDTTVTTQEAPAENNDTTEETQSNSVTNITNNYITNTTNNVTNNTTNSTNNYITQENVYYTVQYPHNNGVSDDTIDILADKVLEEIINNGLANYFPENLQIQEWTGEDTEPECDEVVDDSTDIMESYTTTPGETLATEVPTTSNIDTNEVVYSTPNVDTTVAPQVIDAASTIEEAEYTETIKEDERMFGFAADIKEDSDDNYYISNNNTKKNSEEIVVYTTINGKIYKLTISLK